MVWSWSHAPEAYDAARRNIAAQPRDWLEVCYAEWKACPAGQFRPDGGSIVLGGAFDERRYQRALSAANYMSADDLADRIYGLAERKANCSNGGWDCYCCPSGCHTVAFGREEFPCDLCGAAVERETHGHEHDAGLCATCSESFQARVAVGAPVTILRRGEAGEDHEVGSGVVEEVARAGRGKGIYLVHDATRWGLSDGYDRTALPWSPHSRKRRIVLDSRSAVAIGGAA